MIIVDTGSSDRTVEIAESFGATVLHFAVERLLLRRPQPRPRRAPPARTSSGSTPTSGSRPRTRRAARAGRPALARGALAGRDELHRPGRGRHGREPPRAAPLAATARLPLLGRDPRADPRRDADRPARAVRDLEPADPALRLPQEPHRGAQQARAQPDAAAERSSSATPHNAFTHFNLGTEYVAHGRHRAARASTSSSPTG